MERLYKPSEVAEKLGVPVTTVWEWTRSRGLKCFKVGSRNIRISQSQIDEFLAGWAQKGVKPKKEG